MNTIKRKRKQFFVDPQVQGVLLARTVLYWAFSFLSVTLMLLCWRIVMRPARDIGVHLDYLWFHYKPIAIAAAFLLPVIIVDMIRLSNRFAGPMVRLRRCMGELANGNVNLPNINFRRGDFWHDFATQFNQILLRMQQAQGAANMPRDSAAKQVATSSEADESDKLVLPIDKSTKDVQRTPQQDDVAVHA